MSLIYTYTLEELKKRPILKLNSTGNASPNKILMTTGIGSRTELRDVPLVGNWVYVNTHFNMVPYTNYLVDTSLTTFSGTLPLMPEDKMVVWIKDVRRTFGTKSLFIIRHPASSYTINELNDNLEVNVSMDIFLIYDADNNNWIF